MSLSTPLQYENTKPNGLKINHLDYGTSSRRVLIVDDDREMAGAIKYLVESFGNSICEVVNDPYEALLALSDHKYDFILVDERMPGLNGSSILNMIDEQAKQDPLIIESGIYSHATPTVLMSGAKIKLENNYKLNNFHLLEVLNKKDLPTFIKVHFAS